MSKRRSDVSVSDLKRSTEEKTTLDEEILDTTDLAAEIARGQRERAHKPILKIKRQNISEAKESIPDFFADIPHVTTSTAATIASISDVSVTKDLTPESPSALQSSHAAEKIGAPGTCTSSIEPGPKDSAKPTSVSPSDGTENTASAMQSDISRSAENSFAPNERSESIPPEKDSLDKTSAHVSDTNTDAQHLESHRCTATHELSAAVEASSQSPATTSAAEVTRKATENPVAADPVAADEAKETVENPASAKAVGVKGAEVSPSAFGGDQSVVHGTGDAVASPDVSNLFSAIPSPMANGEKLSTPFGGDRNIKAQTSEVAGKDTPLFTVKPDDSGDGQSGSRPSTFPGEDEEALDFMDWNVILMKCLNINSDEKGSPIYKFRSQARGCARILRNTETGARRVIFRQQGTWKVFLNSPMDLVSKVEKANTTTPRFTVKFRALDHTPDKSDGPKLSVYCLSFDDASVRDRCYEAIKDRA